MLISEEPPISRRSYVRVKQPSARAGVRALVPDDRRKLHLVDGYARYPLVRIWTPGSSDPNPL